MVNPQLQHSQSNQGTFLKKKPAYEPPTIGSNNSPTYGMNPRRNSAQIPQNETP